MYFTFRCSGGRQEDKDLNLMVECFILDGNFECGCSHCREDALIVPIDHIVATVVSFLHTSATCVPIDIGDLESCLSTVVKLCSVFLDCLSSEFAAREQKITAVCLYAENLKGLLNHITRQSHTKYLFNTNPQSTGKSSENGEDTVGPEKEIVQYVILLLFSVTLISKLPESLNLLDKDEMKDDVTEEDVKQEMSSSDIHLLEDHILTAIYSVALCKSFIRHFKSVSHYKAFFLMPNTVKIVLFSVSGERGLPDIAVFQISEYQFGGWDSAVIQGLTMG